MLALSSCGFLCFGFVLVLIGANQADLARDLELDLARTGMLASALAVGLGVGVVGAGPLFDRFARRPLFIALALLTGVALLAFGPTANFPQALLLIALIGVGAGGYDTVFNAWTIEHFGERSAKALTILHAAVAVGAILGPLMVAAVAARWHWTRSFHCVGIAHLALAASALAVRFPEPPARGSVSDARTVPVVSLAMLPFAVIGFAYVGIEISMTVFAVPYATDGLSLDVTRGQTAISSLWLGLLVGRLAPTALRGRLGGGLLLAAGLFGFVALVTGTILGSDRIIIFFACVGFAIGPVYPVVISLAGQRFPDSRGTAAGIAGGAGAVGAFAVPWLTGVIGDGIGIELALGSLALWSLAIALGGEAARRSKGRTWARVS
jgi:fucose permease